MKILFISLGTRGDVEPLAAMAELLSQNGHEVVCAFSERFRTGVERANMEFVSLGTAFMEVLDSWTARKAFGGSRYGIEKLFYHLKLALKFLKIEKSTIKSQYDAVNKVRPDLIVHNGIAVYPFIWEQEHPGQTILVAAAPYYLHYVRDHPYIIFRNNYGPYINKLTYKMAINGTAGTVKKAMKHLNIQRKISKKEIRKRILATRAIYAISRSLFSKPDYWDDSIVISGFFERQKAPDWIPPPELEQFLSKNEKILLISMGSMTNPRPTRNTKVFADILERNRIPGIIVTASGGLVCPDVFDHDLIYFTKNIPYNWLLPRIYGVIHHGGSGTVHDSLKHGCASMAVPHVFDQFIWNKIIHEKGLGPRGIRISRVSKSNLEPLILDLYNNPEYKENAEQIAVQMKDESSAERLCEFITGEKDLSGTYR